MLFHIKKNCFSIAHFCLRAFMVTALITAFQGALRPIIGINRVLAWLSVGLLFLSSALSVLSAIVGGIAVLLMRFAIRSRILKESDLAGLGDIAFTLPRIMQCEIAKKARGCTCIPLVVFGDTGEVRDAVYLAMKAGMTAFGMYQSSIVAGHPFYHHRT